MKPRMRSFQSVVSIALTVLLALGILTIADYSQSKAQTGAPPSLLKGLRWRGIGPYRGGRSVAVTGVPSQPMVYYFGGTGGGVFKTTDGGVSWEPVSDGQPFGTGTVGAIAVADSD